ncbi:type II toxin-antitoxin system VapC family toxin [Thermococcus sp.]
MTNLYELRKFLKTPEGKDLLKTSIETVLTFIGKHEIEVIDDPNIFVSLSVAEKYGLLMHDAKILGAMIENGIENIATLDRDFEGISIVNVLKAD